jgi:hypothetical protein
MASGTSARLVRAEGMPTATLDREAVILNLAGNNYLGLDEVGRRIWELLATPLRVDELCRELAREFEATEEQIAADVLPFLNRLEREGLLRAARG